MCHVLTFLCFQTPSPSPRPQPAPSFSSTCLCFFLPRVEPLSQPCSLPVPPSGLGNEAGLEATSPVRPVLKVSLNERSTCKAKRKNAGQESRCSALLRFLPSRECPGQQGDLECLPPHPPGLLLLCPKRRSGHRPPSCPLGCLHFGGRQRPQPHLFIIMNEAL